MITEDHYEELDRLLKMCVENSDILSQWEHDYVHDWVEKLSEKGTSAIISDKQQAVFDRLQLKLEKEGLL